MTLTSFLQDAPRIVVLAGAGLSVPAPTCGPSWWALNDAVVRALGGALAQLARRPALSSLLADAVRQRRDTTPFLMPDLQAQLLDDELGPAYFEALAALDSDAPNAAHRVLAALALQGRLSAVLTTNFDCTIERCFDAAGVPYRLYTAPEDFDTLDDDAQAPVPVVKIHGSTTRPETMVDTLRQRLQGRPAALEAWMRRRFLQAPTLGIGFSCEDLQYDPDYLGLRPAARDGARMLFLVRAGTPPSKPLQRLVEEFPARVSTASGTLPDWLFDVADALGARHEVSATVPDDDAVAARRAAVAQALDTALVGWAASLGPMAVLNGSSALLAAAGHRRDADTLLRRMWSVWRAPADCRGPAYARYLHNQGEALRRHGQFHNPHDRDQDFIAWKDAADRDPRQFFFRAVNHGGGVDSRARLMVCELLAGIDLRKHQQPALALTAGLAGAMPTLASAQSTPGGPLPVVLLDAAFSMAELLELMGLGRAAANLLDGTHAAACALGDEFRRAEAAWRLARNLAFQPHADDTITARARELAAECSAIAARLDLRDADAGAALAQAIAAQIDGDWAAVDTHARRAEALFREAGDRPGVVFAQRERVRALLGLGLRDGEVDAATFDELSEALQDYALNSAPGLRAVVKYELAMLARFVDDTLALELATDAAADARVQGHPYLITAAPALQAELKGG